MTTETERRLKTALDESPILILGTQVLFGFQFQETFHELFESILDVSRWIHGAGLIFLLLAIRCLIVPSLHHRILFGGESRRGAIATATWLAGASLLPFTLGLGNAAFVAFERMFGTTIGPYPTLRHWFLTATSTTEIQYAEGQDANPLKTTIQQMLTGARSFCFREARLFSASNSSQL